MWSSDSGKGCGTGTAPGPERPGQSDRGPGAREHPRAAGSRRRHPAPTPTKDSYRKGSAARLGRSSDSHLVPAPGHHALLQQGQPLAEIARIRGAPGNVHIHGDDCSDTPDACISVEGPAGTCAGSQRHNPARRQHFVVGLAQEGGEFQRDASRHDQEIGVARGYVFRRRRIPERIEARIKSPDTIPSSAARSKEKGTERVSAGPGEERIDQHSQLAPCAVRSAPAEGQIRGSESVLPCAAQ